MCVSSLYYDRYKFYGSSLIKCGAALAKKKFHCDIDRVLELDRASASDNGCGKGAGAAKNSQSGYGEYAKGSPEFSEQLFTKKYLPR